MVRNVVLPALLAIVADAITLGEVENEQVVSFPFLLPSSAVSSQPQSFASRRAFNKHCSGFVDSAVEGGHAVSAEKLATRVTPLCRGGAMQCAAWSSDLWSAVANKMHVGEYSEGVQKISTRLAAGPETVADWCKEVYSTNLGIDLAVHPTGQEPEFTPQAIPSVFAKAGNAQPQRVLVKLNKPHVNSVVANTSDVKMVKSEIAHQTASEAVTTTSTTTAAPTTTAVPTTTAAAASTTALPVIITTIPAKVVTTTVASQHQAPVAVHNTNASHKTLPVTTTPTPSTQEVPSTTAAPSTHVAAQTTTATPTKVSSPPAGLSIAKLAEKAAAKLAAKHAAAKLAKPISKTTPTTPAKAAAEPAAKVEVKPAAKLTAKAAPKLTPPTTTAKPAAKVEVKPAAKLAAKAAPKLTPPTTTAKPAPKVEVKPAAKLAAKAVPLLRKGTPVIAAAPKGPVAAAATASAHATTTADTAAAKEQCVCVEREGKKTCHCHAPPSDHKRRRYGSR